MSETMSEKLRQFIFEYVDSVEQLDVLLYLRAHSDIWCDAKQITDEFRSTAASVLVRLESLEKIGLVDRKSQSEFRYRVVSPETDDIVRELAEANQVRRHKVLELIFSPMKRARKFADAFRVGKPDQGDGGSDG